MIVIDPTMKSHPSTATALASNRRKLRLAGRSSPYVSEQRPDAENAGSPSSASEASTLSPAARRRLIRAQPGQTRHQEHQQQSKSKEIYRQPQHLQNGEARSDAYTEHQSLNLHCNASIDSDDNGTCFNSIGTTTPRHPPSTSSPQKQELQHHQQTHLHHDLRMPREDFDSSKSSSWTLRPSVDSRRYLERNGKLSPLAEMSPSPRSSNHRPFITPEPNNPTPKENSAYSVFDHWSAAENTKDQNGGGMMKHQQQRRGRSRTTQCERERGIANDSPSVSGSSAKIEQEDGYQNFGERSTPGVTVPCTPVVKEGEAVGFQSEEFLDKPHVKAVLGVGAAATLCAAILGPVGLLVGLASAGIGMGVLQIPEEQRNNVCNHATTSLVKARDMALELSDTVSTSCGKCINNENPADAAEEVRKKFIDQCCSGIDENKQNSDNEGSTWREDGNNTNVLGRNELRPAGSSPMAAALNSGVHNVKGLVGEVFGDEIPSPSNNSAMVSSEEDGLRRVACGRKGRVVPLGQIHSLRPSLQPRAWLDVMASAHTTRDDKNEAMEEILILAKDKDISRWFLEEGILDSLMFILSSYFRNYSAFLRNEPPVSETKEPFQSFKPGGKAFFHARLAANCCVALGKAHCAAVHTEGDLLLMSAYSRGSVPVERQLAQMLFEVPHHMKVINPTQSNHSGGASNENTHDHAEFTLTELSMQQAEDLASSIKSLDDGIIDV